MQTYRALGFAVNKMGKYTDIEGTKPAIRKISFRQYSITVWSDISFIGQTSSGLSFQLHTLLLFHGELALVVAEVLSTKEKGKLWIVLLFLHRHLLKLWPISGNKLGQLVNDIPQLLVWTWTEK